MKFLVVLLGLVCALAHGAPNEQKVIKPHPAYVKDIESVLNVNSRIIGGQDATRDQFPYQISLLWGFISAGSHICGGSIISESVVLTAAHCIQSYGTHSVTAGILNRGEVTETTQSRSVSSIVSHENWPGGSGVGPYDVALMKLATPFTFTSSVQAIPLPSQGAEASVGSSVVSGWGSITSSGSTLPVILQYAEQEIITNTQCAQDLTTVLGSSSPLDDTMICTSGQQRIVVCGGDSGGPLVQDGVLVGVVSWGVSPCGISIAPSVFTRTSSYADWIAANS